MPPPPRHGSVARPYVASALKAETLALKTSIEEAVKLDIKDLACLSDSKGLIALLNGGSSVISLQGILHNIGVLSDSLDSISFSFIPRLCNEAADQLAKNTLFNFPPPMRGMNSLV
uniref:RNase H type-1 domain-containing protein n=1 Tax=Brassica oleracea var. oleracea TaxID=109376 RepID=A0A0D3E644_BRAOL